MLSVRFFSVSSRTWPALVAALLWALLAASAALWWLHLPGGQPSGTQAAAPGPVSAAAPAPGQTGIARALGHLDLTPVAPDAPKRFQVLGVVSGASGQGSALLAVDGQPPAVFVQGQVVAEGWRLQSVRETGVRLKAVADAQALDLDLVSRP